MSERAGERARDTEERTTDGRPGEVSGAGQDRGGPVFTRREAILSLAGAIPGLTVARRLLGQEAPPPLPVAGIHSVTLAVSDVQRSLEFYQRLFGMPIQSRIGDDVLLRIGDGSMFLALTPAGDEGPRIDHWGLAVEGFDQREVIETLSAHDGIRQERGGVGLGGGALRIRSSIRGATPELHMGDLNGLVIQLQDPSYCGGSGPLGADCGEVVPSPYEGDLSLTGMSHLTIMVPDPDATNEFYQRVFGMEIQAYQASSPLLGVGDGVHFLMFIGSGGGPAAVHHACFGMDGFEVDRIQAVLESHGIEPRESAGTGPMRHWVSMRMPNRGGAEGGTPELYFSDPDGLAIQLQDSAYCGGGGYLGTECS